MNAISRGHSTAGVVYTLIVLICATVIAACGGSGGDAPITNITTDPSSTVSTGAVSIVFKSATPANMAIVTKGVGGNGRTETVVLTFTVLNAQKKGLANQKVTFSQIGAKPVTLVASSGITDTAGDVSVTVASGVDPTNVRIVASVDGTNLSVTSDTIYVTAVTPTAIVFKSAVPANKSIVIKGAGGNGQTDTALLTFTVLDAVNIGIPNQKVTFTTNSSQPVTLATTTGITNSSGEVTVTLNSGSAPTTVRVIANVDGTTLGVMSDTVRVTTGEPVQAALSLAMEQYAIEGWDWDNTKQKAIVLVADAFGGAVADGTQVVFTTDSGAIIGTGGSGCVTGETGAAGECSVTWRSQSPRLQNGVATITATATSGANKLSTQKSFYVSGSYSTMYQRDPANLGVRLPSVAPFDFTNSCDPQTILIELVDQNGNPLPVGTTLTATASLTVQNSAGAATATLFPATLANPSLLFSSANRGTLHEVTVRPLAGSTDGTNIVSGCYNVGTSKNGALNIAVTTPKGVVTYQRINMIVPWIGQ